MLKSKAEPVEQAKDVIQVEDDFSNMVDETEQNQGLGFQILWPGKTPDPNAERAKSL